MNLPNFSCPVLPFSATLNGIFRISFAAMLLNYYCAGAETQSRLDWRNVPFVRVPTGNVGPRVRGFLQSIANSAGRAQRPDCEPIIGSVASFQDFALAPSIAMPFDSAGNRIRNVLPRFTALSMSSVPLWRLMIPKTMDNPRPVPLSPLVEK